MSRELITSTREFRHFHFCCGLGCGKQGFNAVQPQVGNMAATLRCIGGIDNDPAAIRDFDRSVPGRPRTFMDLVTRAQHTAFHGNEPPSGWREATVVDTGLDRAWVKTAEPNTWRKRAILVWEAEHGPVAHGLVIHYRDRDSLSDAPTNIQALTRREHAGEHCSELEAAGVQNGANFAYKRERRTKSLGRQESEQLPKLHSHLQVNRLKALTIGNQAFQVFFNRRIHVIFSDRLSVINISPFGRDNGRLISIKNFIVHLKAKNQATRGRIRVNYAHSQRMVRDESKAWKHCVVNREPTFRNRKFVHETHFAMYLVNLLSNSIFNGFKSCFDLCSNAEKKAAEGVFGALKFSLLEIFFFGSGPLQRLNILISRNLDCDKYCRNRANCLHPTCPCVDFKAVQSANTDKNHQECDCPDDDVPSSVIHKNYQSCMKESIS